MTGLNFQQVGMRLKTARKCRGLTQEQLAEQASLSPTYVSCIERGKKKVSLTALARIAETLGVGVDELLGIAPVGECGNGQETLLLLEDCSLEEKQIICDTATALKQSLRLCRQTA